MRQLPSPQTGHSLLQAFFTFMLGLGLFSGTLALLKDPGSSPSDLTRDSPAEPVELPLAKPRKATPQLAAATVLTPAPTPDHTPYEAVRGARDEETGLALVDVLKTDPNHIGAAEAFYLLYEKRGDLEGALAVLQTLEMEGSAAAIDYAQARLYLQFGHPEEARTRLERVLESGVDQPSVREQLATAYWDLGERERSRQEWEALAQNESAGPVAWKAKAKLAELLFLEGRHSEADRYIKDVLQQDPQNRVGVLLSGR